MERKQIFIVGGGGHAKVVASVLKKNTNYDVVGFFDDNTEKTSLLGIPKAGPVSPVNKNTPKSYITLGIGHVGNTTQREKITSDYETTEHTIENVIASSAIINEDVTLGKGIVIFDGAIIQPGVTIGDYSIINTKASVDHDCIIGKHVHIAPGATLSGNVTVGDGVLVGVGASVIQGVTIAKGCIVGAGAVVISDCNREDGVYVGSPAQLIKIK